MERLAKITCICPDCAVKHVKELNPDFLNSRAMLKIDGKPSMYCPDCQKKRLDAYLDKINPSKETAR